MFCNLNSKLIYWHLLQKYIKQPTSIARWISEFPFLHDTDFDEFFVIPYKTVRETRLQTFQYKVFNNILACKEKLYQWSIVEDDHCVYCNDYDTVTRFLYTRETVRTFWRHVENWVVQILETRFPLSITDVIFGITFTNDNLLLYLNYILLYSKWYIYHNKLNGSKLCTLSFVVELKKRLQIERHIMYENGQQDKFEEKWSALYDNI
jgi:hypothetical protein